MRWKLIPHLLRTSTDFVYPKDSVEALALKGCGIDTASGFSYI